MPDNATRTSDPAEELLSTATVPLVGPVTVGLKVTCTVACCPGCNVSGKFAPLMENPAPDTVTELICTAAVPVESSVSFCTAELPSVTLPKLTFVEFTVNVGVAGGVVGVCCTPVPLRFTSVIAGPEDELEVIAKVPAVAPVLPGLKLTWSVTFWPAFSVIGTLAPASVNPVPLSAADCTCKATVLLLKSVRDCVADCPTVTEPKLMLVWLTASAPLEIPDPHPAIVNSPPASSTIRKACAMANLFCKKEILRDDAARSWAA